MIARKIFLAFTFAVMLIVSTAVARAQSGEPEQPATEAASQGGILDVLERIRQAQSQQFEGSWAITVTPAVPAGAPQPPSFRAYATVSRGGAYFGSGPATPSVNNTVLGHTWAAMTSPIPQSKTSSMQWGVLQVRPPCASGSASPGRTRMSASPTPSNAMPPAIWSPTVAQRCAARASRSSRSRRNVKASRRLSKWQRKQARFHQ